MKFQIPIYAGVQLFDTGNTPNAGVIRNPDGSVNVGLSNTTGIDNTAGVSLQPKNIVAAGTLDFTSTLITVDATAAAFALTLPPVAASIGFFYCIAKKDGAHAVTLTGNGAELIVSSGASGNTLVMNTQGGQLIVWTDGTQWYAK